MTTTLILAIILLVLIIGIIALFRSNQRITASMHEIQADNASKAAMLQSTSQQLAESKEVATNAANESRALTEQVKTISAENARLNEKIHLITEEKARLQQEAENRFKLLANEIFDDKTKKFKELNETRISEILTPLKERINQFETTIRQNATSEAKDREALKEHIRTLMELNKNMSKDAKDLTQALKGNSKIQGDWGEMILKDILESCGLQEGVEFTVQQTRDNLGNVLTGDNGRTLRPDVIVKLPGEKEIIIDSKVSLTDYVEYVNCEDDEARKSYLSKHVASVKRHIDELKTKKYQNAVANSADFVMMFVPNEGAYITAMQADQSLWKYAYDNHVVLLCPTHLISVLKLVEQLWRHDKQTKNAIKIAEESGKLYDKFVGFVDDMKAIDRTLTSTRAAYDSAMNKLQTGRGNLIKRIEDIKDLGAKASKNMAISSGEE